METNIRYRIHRGQIEIDGTVYIIDRAFSQSILFLRIDKAETGYEAMLSVKSDDDSSLPLFREMAQLTISDELFSQISQFQTIRRGSDTLLRLRGLDTQSSESWETVLIGALHQTFFAGDIGTVCRDFLDFLQKGKIKELLLVISSDEETIQNLPWEMVLPKLSPNAYGLPKNTFGLVRSQEKNLEQFDRQGPTVETAPLKMLFIPALPENMPERSKRLEIEEEQRKIIQAVRQLEATGNQRPKLVMEILDCADLAEIREALQNRSHDIVHISGHGAYIDAVKAGILYLENEDGNEQQTTGQELGLALREFASIKLLVLSACETAVGGSTGSTAEQMAAVGLPAVLAMRFAVTDAGARLFTEKLYERLTGGNTLTKAMHDARLALWTYIEQQRQLAPQVVTPAEWFTPVLYQNQYMGALVKPGQYDSSTLNRFYPKAAFIKGTHTRLIGEGFIGRKRLLIQLRQCFQHGKHVCLHGLGGLGKTTTAEAFADSYRKRYGHDILVFRNGPEIQEAVILERLFTKWKLVTQPEEYLIQQVRALLDSPDHSAEAKLQLLIDNYLNENPTILIFDNFEDVQTEGDDTQQQAIVSDSLRTFMRHLLQHTPPSCPVLLTSRYLITDLADLVTHLAVDKMTSAEQYRYINFSEVLRNIPLEERAIIDRRFDGHPRALQFLEGLLSKDRQFDMTKLDASMGAVEARIFENLLLQRIYNRLSEDERAVFLAASIFFTRTPLAALSAIVEKQADELTPILAALRDWSLCFWEAQEQLFEVHALTRTWLRNQQQPALDQFRTLSKRAGEFFQQQPTWDDQLLAKAYFEQAEAWEAYAQATFNLEDHYRLIGLYPVARDLAQDVLSKNISPYYNAEAQNSLGVLDLNVGNYKQALSYLEQSLSIRQQIGDKKGEGATLNNISQIYNAQGDYVQALSYLEQSLSICRQIGSKLGEGAILNNIGNINRVEGDYDRALSYLEQSLDIYLHIGNKPGEGVALNSISQIYNDQGDYAQALNYLEQSLSIRQQIGDKKGEGTALNNIGNIYRIEGDYGRALSYLEQSLSIAHQIGNKIGQASTMYNLGVLYFKQFQNLEKATPLLMEAYAIFKQIGSPIAKSTLSYLNAILEKVGKERFDQLIQGGGSQAPGI